MSARENLIGFCLVALPNEPGFARAERLADAYRAEVLREVYAAIQDPQQRAAVGGGLGWETARDVVHNLLRKTEGGDQR
ncbi:hypothetical protein [Streptomyces sp.]|uniref:hypothetical protein n=1 Tax=Streptomyces sp. TaxID=1931 RepID=UPI0028127BCF|nr:hypothetical protein [Streptomyces sp.]